MANEEQVIEIPAWQGPSRLIIRKDSVSETVSVRISTPDFNVAAIVNPEQLLTAVRTLCEP